MAKRQLNRRQNWRIEKIQGERAARAAKRESSAVEALEGGDLGPEQLGLVIAHFGVQVEVEATEGDHAGQVFRCHLRANLPALVTGDTVVWRAGNQGIGVIVAAIVLFVLLVAVASAADYLACMVDDHLMGGVDLPAPDFGHEPLNGGKIIAIAVSRELGDIPAVTAADAAGRQYALTALAQLLRGARAGDGFRFPASGHVRDYPRFSWRGCHLDTARRFFATGDLARFLDCLAYLRLNVFHWHLTDDEAWRLEIKAFPTLTTVGATRGPDAPLLPQLGNGAEPVGGRRRREDGATGQVLVFLLHASGGQVGWRVARGGLEDAV